jgi:hypothetical protein
VVKIQRERKVLPKLRDFDTHHNPLVKRECDIARVIDVPRSIEGSLQHGESFRFGEEY